MQLPFLQSLRFRLIAGVVIIEIVMLSIMVWNNVESIYRTHTDRLMDTAQSVLQQFASIAGKYIVEVDYAGLEEHANYAFQQDEVAYLIVLEPNGKPVIQLGRRFTGKFPTPDQDPKTVTDGVYDLAQNITLANRPTGRVLMGFSLDLMNASIRAARNRSIAIASTEILLSILVTIFLGVSLTRNLKSLAEAAGRVGQGDYSTVLPIQRNDEVGMTAHAFNKMVVDIAERSRSIEESQASVRLLMDSTFEAIIGVDLNSCCIFVNQACLRMLGYEDPQQILGQDFHELAHYKHPDGSPYPAEECTIRIGAKNEGGISHFDNEQFIRADGSFFPVEAWTYPIIEHGNRVGYVVTFIDISERKQAEFDIERLNRQLSLLLESTGEGIFGVDREMRCTFVNQAAARMLGYSPEQLRGQDMCELVNYAREDGTLQTREECLIYRCMQTGHSMESGEETLWTKNGEFFPAQYSASPITEYGEITGAAVVFRNVSEARAMARKMDYLATHDPLTGLFNRREFEVRLQKSLEDAQIDNSEHILCYLDLDQFKVVNDTCGHVAGDELLRQLSGLLHSKIRKHDTLARLGGDEFGLLLNHCNLEYALKVIEDIRHTVRDFRFSWDEKTFSVGVSIGLTVVTAQTGNVGNALGEADAACYVAKDSGRNRIHVYEKDDADLAKRHGEMQWVSVISSALDADRFSLHFQPIVAATDSEAQNRCIHFEVLLRLQDESGNNLPPGAFIPAAERYSLMQQVDSWVVNTFFKWFARHRDEVRDIETCAINLSGQSLNDEQFLQMVCTKLNEWKIAGSKICFEITETAAVANLNQATRFIKTLKAKGCRFALDDFGSGMSSFAYLKNLPVDFLKIDGHFVRDIVEDEIDFAMVKAVNQVGQVMGIKTIAEFVENDAILGRLRNIGVDYVQGYGIAEPRPLDELLAQLATMHRHQLP